MAPCHVEPRRPGRGNSRLAAITDSAGDGDWCNRTVDWRDVELRQLRHRDAVHLRRRRRGVSRRRRHRARMVMLSSDLRFLLGEAAMVKPHRKKLSTGSEAKIFPAAIPDR